MLHAFLALVLLGAPPSDADRVLVVRNANSPVSVRITEYYTRKRGVDHVLAVKCADSAVSAANETIAYADFKEQIGTPLRAYLSSHPHIAFIVMTKGVPIRIEGATGLGLGERRPSLDSFVAALDYDKAPNARRVRLTWRQFSGTAYVNRYWRSSEPFSHAKFGGYLVTRLDGYTEADATALVDRAIAAERSAPSGQVLLDACPAFGFADAAKQPAPILVPGSSRRNPVAHTVTFGAFNADMVRAASILRSRGRPVELDKSDAFLGHRADLAGYVSWGSNDRQYNAAAYHSLRFAPGAIGDTAVSTSGRTFLRTSGGQSLVADLIAQGITGVKAYADEPLLRAIASPSILFDRYTSGANLAESFYAASRFIGWEDIVLGDPLCRPYGRAPRR